MKHDLSWGTRDDDGDFIGSLVSLPKGSEAIRSRQFTLQ